MPAGSQGDSFIQEAQKALSTGFFKRKPEYEMAAAAYENAAKAFEYEKRFPDAIESHLKSSECHRNCENIYFAAKSIESAAQTCWKSSKDYDKTAQLYVQSSQLYARNNNVERAIEQLERAGKALLDGTPDDQRILKAIDILKQACDLYEAEDKLRTGLETFKKVSMLMLSRNDTASALEFMQRTTAIMIKIDGKHLTMRHALSHIIVALYAYGQNDIQSVSNLFHHYGNQIGSWPTSDEGIIAGELMDAFEHGNQDLLVQSLQRPLITFLDNHIVKIARQLRVPGAPITIQEAASTNPARIPEQSTSLCDDIVVDTNLAASKEETSDLC